MLLPLLRYNSVAYSIYPTIAAQTIFSRACLAVALCSGLARVVFAPTATGAIEILQKFNNYCLYFNYRLCKYNYIIFCKRF